MFLQKIREFQKCDNDLEAKRKLVGSEQTNEFNISDDENCVPNDTSLKPNIIHKAHNNTYVMHPGDNKMYNDLRLFYW
ncbi:integrase [Gossypium australe]|uniref:Integrase n=1 Tax=Gossypium australe TaxID=47621 RepID=A0A5B6X1H9_9ROSI|nr:integrase [Gossypium australe]